MLESRSILDLGRISIDAGEPMGMRFYASAYLLMAFAPPRFPEAKAAFGIWRTESAVCWRSMGLNL